MGIKYDDVDDICKMKILNYLHIKKEENVLTHLLSCKQEFRYKKYVVLLIKKKKGKISSRYILVENNSRQF